MWLCIFIFEVLQYIDIISFFNKNIPDVRSCEKNVNNTYLILYLTYT